MRCSARIIALVVATSLAAAPSSSAPRDPPGADSAPTVVIYPWSGRDTDTRGSYYVQLLRLVLGKSDGRFDIRPSAMATVNLRVMHKIASNDGIDIMWSPTSTQLEQELLPVRISLDKGLLGWRLFLIDARDQDTFAAIRTFDQLKAYEAGQVTEWADTAVMRANGLTVVDTPYYESLFRMLAAHRFRFLPRGVGEIDGEARNYASLGLVVEQHLALHYPYCTYFFVRKDDVALARHIETGLRRAQKDGSFEALFRQFNGEAIQRAALDRRRVFELVNPTAPSGPGPGPDACTTSGRALLRLH